jgi:hypothetical protein
LLSGAQALRLLSTPPTTFLEAVGCGSPLSLAQELFERKASHSSLLTLNNVPNYPTQGIVERK